MTKNYCKRCKRTVELTEEGRCCNCGTQLNDTGSEDRYYICRPQQSSALTINLEPQQKLFNDRYTIVKLIGTGSSKIYLAEDNVRFEQVALKVIPLVSEEMANQLKRQFESWHKVIDYSHIIRLYDVHIIPYEGVVLLMVSTEYADGGTFRQWLIQNKDNTCKRQTEGLFYIKQALRGIEALHAADLVHGNFKPESLGFVDGTLKVMDIGLSRHMRDIQSSGYNHNQPGPEISPGKYEYMSPEQFMAARSGVIDFRSDIYALGVILFETCDTQARPPFEGAYWQLRRRHLNVPAPVLKDVSANVARVAARCLQKDPGARYEMISQLIDDLEGGCNIEASQAGAQQSTEAIQELWDKACEFMDDGNLNEAGKLCDRILSIFPEYSQARAMREEIDSRFEQARQFYETIKKGIGNQPLQQLLALLDEAVQLFQEHPDGALVQNQLQSITGEYKNAMHGGIEAIGKGHWQEALRNFKRARELNPGLPRITELIDFVSNVSQQIETARTKVDAATQRQDWDNATSWARTIDRYVDNVKGMATSLRNQEQRL
jgi:serine/threonine-protein kinase